MGCSESKQAGAPEAAAAHMQRKAQMSVLGDWNGGTITHDGRLIFRNGSQTPLMACTQRSVQISVNGQVLAGQLGEDGRLYWSDNDVWHRKEARQAPMPMFAPNEPVEVYSHSHGQWFPGMVIEVFGNGSVRVMYGDSEKVIPPEEVNPSTIRKAMYPVMQPDTFYPQEPVEVFSVSQQQWFDGVVIEVFRDGSVRVGYGDSEKVIPPEECNPDFIRKVDSSGMMDLHPYDMNEPYGMVETYGPSQGYGMIQPSGGPMMGGPPMGGPPFSQQYMPNISRPQMTSVANPPIVDGANVYGPSSGAYGAPRGAYGAPPAYGYPPNSNLPMEVNIMKPSRAIQNQFQEHDGYISKGGDICKRVMTIGFAKITAASLPDCKGFCFRGPPTQSGEVEVHFKSHWDIAQGKNQWTSYQRVGQVETDPTHFSPNCPFVPPGGMHQNDVPMDFIPFRPEELAQPKARYQWGDQPPRPGGAELDQECAKVLASGDLRLVSALWLLQQPEDFRVDKRQKLPKEAFIDPAQAAEMLLHPYKCPFMTLPRIVADSYRWLTPEHPDPDGYFVRQLRGFLNVHVGAVWDFCSRFKWHGSTQWQPFITHNYPRPGTTTTWKNFATGEWADDQPPGLKPEAPNWRDIDVGIMWDFMSVLQPPFADDEERAAQRRGLGVINTLYGSKEGVLTLQLSTIPPGSSAKPYAKSGWCQFEQGCGLIVKSPQLMINLNDVKFCIPQRPDKPKSIRDPNPMYAVDPAHTEEFTRANGGAPLLMRLLDFHHVGTRRYPGETLGAWSAMMSKYCRSRPPPVHPDEMEALLLSDAVTFTAGSDKQMVIDKYRKFWTKISSDVTEYNFEAPVEHFDGIECRNTGGYGGSSHRTTPKVVKWSAEDMHKFAQSLASFPNCKRLMLGGHVFTEETAQILVKVLSKKVLPNLEEVDFRWSPAPKYQRYTDDRGGVEFSQDVANVFVQSLRRENIRCHISVE